jgi:hypothetical protein
MSTTSIRPADLLAEYGVPYPPPGVVQPDPQAWPEPEDRGGATLSALGDVEYVEDLGIRPGRLVVLAGEEGTGKSMAIQELAVRICTAGGSFAGTWPVLRQGAVLVLSEMHPDDDYQREELVLAALGLSRAAIAGRLFRLPLMTAAGGKPVLTMPEWRTWITEWCRDHAVVLAVFDTATGATQVDPWGKAIQEVFAGLRMMVEAYPALAIVLLLHLKKPQGKAERRISDVLGEWGRWCDVVLLMEQDGTSLERVRLTVRKRVRHQRRIAVMKAGGLLVDPVDLDEAKGAKVPTADVLAAIAAQPGIGYAALGERLGVSKDTAARYVAALGDQVDVAKTGQRGAAMVFLTAAPPQSAA